MAQLIYPTNMSLDGFIEDANGAFDFLPVDDELFAAHTDLIGSVGTHLYGRRLYESMAVWETDKALAAQSDAFAGFSAAWTDAEKVVYSTTLDVVSTVRTRIARTFVASEIRELKRASDRDITIGGAELAAHALDAGLIDEIQIYVAPIVVGGGKPALPAGFRSHLDLVEERRFSNGVVLLRYRVTVA